MYLYRIITEQEVMYMGKHGSNQVKNNHKKHMAKKHLAHRFDQFKQVVADPVLERLRAIAGLAQHVHIYLSNLPEESESTPNT